MKQMNKLLLSQIVLLLFAGQVFSQDFKMPKKKVRCYTDEYLQELRTTNPTVMSNQDFETWLQPLIYQHKKNINAAPQNGAPISYKLPIVFHIIYNGEAEGDTSNVAQDLINEQVIQLNKDYANLSNSPYAVAANSGIQFGLAAVDPSGNTLVQPGIDRQSIKTHGWTAPPYNDAGQSTGYFWTTIKGATIWDPTKYVNVWVADIASGTSGIVGIATFPTASTLQGLTPATETVKNAGIVVDYTTIGSVYSPNPNGNSTCGKNVYALGKSATHELGHFFGLRHIWGDGSSTTSCATDYANDTPPAIAANYGTPTHPKSNVCGTADEMFEDYMDYSDDHIMSTFTQNQVDRMQTVMKNSPWRKTLPNAVAMIDPTGTNEISFTECSGAISTAETGTTGTYPRYHDMSIMLNVDNAATDNSSIVSVTATGTAVAGVDYQIMNPDISFAQGDKYKAIQLRIFDNNVIDGDRYLFLNYTISGTGIVAGANTQSVKINIMDDDNIKIGQNRTSLINQSFGTTGGALPTGWYAGGTSTTNSFVVGSVASTGMTGQYAYVTNNKTTKPLTYAKGTDASSYLYFLVNGFSLMSLDTFAFTYKVGGVADNTTTGAGGDYAWTLYTGLHDTLPGLANFGTVGDATGATPNTGFGPYYTQTTAKRMSLIPTADMVRNKIIALFYFQTGTQTTGKNPGFEVDSIVLRGMPFKVETAVSTSYGFDVPAVTMNVYRSANNKAMLKFKDGPTPITNLTASIIDAGTTLIPFTTAAGTYNRAKKVFKLTSSAVDNASLDSIIFYFTTAELAAWGSKISSLKVLQVNDGVNYTSPLNSGNSVLLTPVVDTTRFITDSLYSFLVYTKGLGTFMLVDPSTALPLNMISFKGKLRENITYLNWSTSNEYNTSGFEVERSTNGEIFTSLGWVNSLGTAAVNNYSYTDNSIVKGNKYYYRLKQVDKDGKFTYSTVVIIAYLGGNNYVNIYPNPVKNNLFIEKQNGSITNTNIVITDVSGKVVYHNNSTLSTTLNIETNTWSRGVYFVKVNSNEGSSTIKIVKE